MLLCLLMGCSRRPGPWTFADFPGFREYRCAPTASDPADKDARRVLQRFRPRLVVAPGASWPIDFYRDYLPNAILRDADRAGHIITRTVTREVLQSIDPHARVYLELQRLPEPHGDGKRPVVYGRLYRESVPLPASDGDSVTRQWTFLKYNVVFVRSGLPAGLPWMYEQTLRLVRLSPEDWHQLDNFCAVHIVLDEEGTPVAVLLAQHNHHRSYLIGRDLVLPRDERLVVAAAQRSNELYLDQGETKPQHHRTIPWAWHLDYLLSGNPRPWVTADDITYGRAAGGEDVPYELAFLAPCDPFYTARSMLGQYRPLLGLEIGRNGPPGADYYTLPELMPLGTLLKASYLQDDDEDDIQAVRAAIDREQQHFNAALLIEHGERTLAHDLSRIRHVALPAR
jgi:hypothetical protein